MTLRIHAKVLLHVWSYDFYDMTLSTEQQRRHMINRNPHQESLLMYHEVTIFFPQIKPMTESDIFCWKPVDE